MRRISHGMPLSLLLTTRTASGSRTHQPALRLPVNICTLMPKRSIPFKVVCLLELMMELIDVSLRHWALTDEPETEAWLP
ncbi:hypothetical protein ACNKHU_17125 [Shigella flexneri]